VKDDHIIFKRRILAEKIVLKAATKELEEVLAMGVTKDLFLDQFHKDFLDNIITRDKCKENISTPAAHIRLLENPTGRSKDILDIYNMDISKYIVSRMVEVLKEWSELDSRVNKATQFIHRVQNWDFKEKTSVLFEMFDNISELQNIDVLKEDFTPNCWEETRDIIKNGGNNSRIIRTGICYLDKKLGGGFKTRRLYTVAARTGCGKTAFATNITLTAAQQGYHCLYVTLEMTKQEIHCRMLSTLSEVPIEKFDNSSFTAEESELVDTALLKLKDLPITIDWRSRGDWSHIEKMIRAIKKERGLSFVVVDYIQQYSCPSRGFKAADKRQEIDYMTGRFKQMALELDFAAIMLAQLNRDMEKDGERSPRLSDIKESSSIEQDSDVVLMLYCKNQARVDAGEDPEKNIAVKTAKNRSGNVGIEDLHTKLSINKFYGI
jgi:replicative DNA helicase